MPERFGRYRILHTLGEGGMGVVYAAHDEQLDRRVAIKTIRDPHADPRSRERFWREARSAARVSHPNVCPIYEVGEENGTLFIAMELLEGEPLASRLARGPLEVGESSGIALSVLAALEVLHRGGVIHRDLKPSNIFITPHGTKLVDFGLALPGGNGAEPSLTQTGIVLGTPRYMAPEQVGGQEVDARSDLFAVGAVLYEMLTGRPAFPGATVVEVLHAVLHDQPPALVGSSTIAAVDRVIQRALAKRAAERYAGAAAMAEDLRVAMVTSDSIETPRARAMTRLIVLPLRVLRSDPETDFLAVGLADAVTSSLSGLESLTVRSSLAAARFAGETPDLARIASETQVDAVLAGTLMRAGDRVRVNVQLLEAPAGTVLWTQTDQVPLDDLFQLQDDLARRIVESLSVPLSARERGQWRHDVPASPEAYELFLRANQLNLDPWQLTSAQDLYVKCLEKDPRFAPAWAQLGRCYRVLAKYGAEDAAANIEKAEGAFHRALELNPELSIAHTLYAAHETELGRANEAMRRLLGRAASRPSDPDLYSGLCHTLRYAGLLEASRAAHEKATRLDPTLLTSATFTYYFLGQLEKALEADRIGLRFNSCLVLFDMGRKEEAIAHMKSLQASRHPAARLLATVYCCTFEDDVEAAIEGAEQLLATGFIDPEGWYLLGRSLVKLGEIERGLVLVGGVVAKGYHCYTTLMRDSWLDAARTHSRFPPIVRDAEARFRDSRAAYVAANGERILGPGTAA